MDTDRPTRRLAFLLPDLTGGGAERVALTLIGDFIDRGYQVDLLLMRRSGDLLDVVPPSVRIVDLRAPKVRDVLWPLVRYLRTERPDGLQVMMWPLTVVGVLGHRLARSKARLVLSDHTTLSRHNAHLGRIATRAMRASIRLCYPLADARVIVSERSADDLAALSGLPRSSIEVVYNPVVALPADDAAPPDWGSGARILTVGNLKLEKNHELLIRAFARLAADRPASLVIVGEGDRRAGLEQLARDLDVAERVRLPGYLVNPWGYYRSADLFVLSSDYEGFGLVLVEALRCGLRVVSTDCEAGPREILADGRYGTLVPPGDADALATAMLTALDAPVDAQAQMARAEQVSGSSASDRHLQLMLGAAGAPADRV